MKSNMMSNQEV